MQKQERTIIGLRQLRENTSEILKNATALTSIMLE